VGTDRLCETRWLHRVLDCLSTAGRVRTSTGLGALRDELSARVNDPDAPRAEAFATEGDRFRRHPLATVNSQGYSALLMYWPAGYATLPHDHDGLWGIEVVIDGRLDIDEYVKSGPADQPTLSFVRSLQLGAGEATMFTSDQYVHRCRNRSNVASTLTLHVYSGTLDAFTNFESDTTGRVTPSRRTTVNDRLLS
jgi:hypothetical protein